MSASFKKALVSQVGRKIVMALTGLALVGFVITHLLGNLLLLTGNPDLFNTYAFKLEELGPLLYAAEVGLMAVFLGHILTALTLKLGHRAAKPVGYKNFTSKKGPSRYNLSSATMIMTGVALLSFLIAHVVQIKFGPGMAAGYVTQIKVGGELKEVRDLYRLVFELFSQPVTVTLYVLSMLLLGMHLRHGFWSAFQSLGLMHPRFDRAITLIGYTLAALLAVGFLMIPVMVYMTQRTGAGS